MKKFLFLVFVLFILSVLSVFVAGCANWSNHTTVLGIEAAWNPQSLIPTGRAGLIDHDNNGVSNDAEDIVSFVWKKYDNLNLWCLSGTAQTISYTGPVDSELAKAAAEYIKVQTAAAKNSELPVNSVPSVAPK